MTSLLFRFTFQAMLKPSQDKEDTNMMEQEFLVKKICDYVEEMDLRTLRMVWSYIKKLVH